MHCVYSGWSRIFRESCITIGDTTKSQDMLTKLGIGLISYACCSWIGLHPTTLASLTSLPTKNVEGSPPKGHLCTMSTHRFVGGSLKSSIDWWLVPKSLNKYVQTSWWTLCPCPTQYSMENPNTYNIFEQLRNFFHNTRYLHWHEDGILGKYVPNHNDSSVPLQIWHMGDELHRNAFLRSLRHNKVCNGPAFIHISSLSCLYRRQVMAYYSTSLCIYS